MSRRVAVALIGLLAGCTAAPGPVATTGSTPETPPTVAPATTAPSAAAEPTATPAGAVDPPLLPGESWIAFQSDAGGGIYGIRLIRADGTGLHFPAAAEQIGGSPQLHPEWSPDGNKLAFAASGSASTNLWLVDLVEGEIHPIADCTTGCSVADEPAWSRDGKTIAFHRQALEDGNWVSTLELYDVGARTTRVVLKAADDRLFFAPRWSPDGSQIVAEYVHRTRNTLDGVDSGQLVIVDVASARPTARVITTPDYWPANSDWSPDGKSIVFFRTDDPATVEGPSDLWTIRPDGTGLARLTQFADEGGSAVHPAFTPDGIRILFVAFTEATGNGVMATVAVDGSDLQPAVAGRYVEGLHPRFRPVPS